MKEKILRMVMFMIIVISLIAIGLIIFFNIEDAKVYVPNKAEYSANIDEKNFNSRKLFIITPKNIEKNEKVILYFHGGSYMAEATKAHWNFLGNVSNDTGNTIVMIDYPLAPKYTYKEVFKIVEPLYKEAVKQVGKDNLILMGDSAGGGLALALAELAAEQNEELPSKVILISPWLDTKMENVNIDEVQKNDRELNKEALKLAGLAYAGKDGENSYLVNPIDGDLSKIRNLIIFTGTYDILNPDVHVLEEKAKNEGINVEIKEYEKASHIWLIDENSEIQKEAYNDLIECIKK